MGLRSGLSRVGMAALVCGVVGCSSISGNPQSAPDSTSSAATETTTETETETTTTTTTSDDDQTGVWSDALVVVTTNSVGAATLGMTVQEVESAADVDLTLECTQCDANYVAQIAPKADHARFEVRHNCSGFDLTYVPTQSQVVATEDGFKLGGSVAELQEIYGADLESYQAQGLYEFTGYTVKGEDGQLIFRPGADDPSMIDGFLVWPLEYTGC